MWDERWESGNNTGWGQPALILASLKKTYTDELSHAHVIGKLATEDVVSPLGAEREQCLVCYGRAQVSIAGEVDECLVMLKEKGIHKADKRTRQHSVFMRESVAR